MLRDCVQWNRWLRWLGLSIPEISVWDLFRVVAGAVGFDFGEFAAIRRGSYSPGVA